MVGGAVDTAVLLIGQYGQERAYRHFADDNDGEVVEDSIDEDGTLRAHGTLFSEDDGRHVQIEVSMRCPDG